MAITGFVVPHGSSTLSPCARRAPFFREGPAGRGGQNGSATFGQYGSVNRV